MRYSIKTFKILVMKKMLKIFIILALINYAAAACDNVYLFAVSFPVFIFWGIAVMAKLLIKMFVAIFSEKYRKTFQVIIPAIFLFIYFGWVLNFYFLPGRYSLISLVGNCAFFILAIFLCRALIKKTKKSWLSMIASSLIFLVFIFLWCTYGGRLFGNITISKKEALKSLPYIMWAPAEKTAVYAGVTKYDPAKACIGVNLYTSINLPKAYLMDMEGNILHAWSAKNSGSEHWYAVEMNKKGDIFVLTYEEKFLFCVGYDSIIKWKKDIIAHHDIAIADNGDLYTLSRKNKFIFKYGLPLPITDDYIMIFSPDGEFKKEISVCKIFKKNIKFSNFAEGYLHVLKYAFNPMTFARMTFLPKNMEERIKVLKKIKFDILHDNRIQIINRDVEGLCKKGNLLLSLRNLDLIAIVDLEKESIVWQWGPGIIEMQHYPTLLENNNILLFDNGTTRGYSRVIELNPLTGNIVWEYKASPPQDFFSPFEGSCQRLPNGNTLICESERGRVFEVTNAGQIVWEFYNPEIDDYHKKRAVIYRLIRIFDLPAHK